MVEHFIDEFIGSVIGQCLDQIAVSHISGSQTIAVCFHIFYQVLEYFALQMTIRFITSSNHQLLQMGKTIGNQI